MTVRFDGAPIGAGELAVVVAFALGTPTPNSGYMQAGSDMTVEAAIYGFLDLAASFAPQFYCEWNGDSIGGTFSTPATLLPAEDARQNPLTITLTILGGGEGVSWSLEYHAGQTWQTVVGGGGGASYTGAGQYQDSSPCAENVGVLQTVAEGFLTDPRQAALVDWAATTCADALGLLNKYGLACEVRPHHCMLQAS